MPDPQQHLSLRRGEAQERARILSAVQLLVELDLTTGDRVFASTTTLTFAARPGTHSFVDFAGEELRSATLNDQPLDRSTWRAGRIPLPHLRESNQLVVVGVMTYSSDGEGMYRYLDPADSQTYLYAMSFLDAAPRWFACFDQPDLKATYELQVRVPTSWIVIGNGPSTMTAPGHWQLRPPQPLSTYVVTLVAGPYVSVTDEHDGIPLGFHARATLTDALTAQAADLVAVTKASFDYYHRVFGVRYPFGEYHQAFVPDFNAGAMENAGCVTLRDSLLFRARATHSERAGRATTMAHEMAHMWFGDLVTMTWWDDLWLNESFAEYLAHRVSHEATGYPSWTEFGMVRKDWGSVADQSPSTHPVAGNGSPDAETARQAFDGISYAKGAAVLGQLVSYLGEDVFWAGLRAYFSAHAFANAELADLMAAWTSAGAVHLDEWAAAWLHTTGMDTLDAVLAPGSAMISRTPPAGQDGQRSHAVQVGAVDLEGRIATRTPVVVADQPVRMEVRATVALLIPDAGNDTWAKIRFGAGGWSRVAAVLDKIDDPAARVVVFNSIRDAVRGAELAPGRALELICDHLLAEPSDVVLTSMLRFAQDQLAGPFARPEQRPARRQRVHETACAILAACAPGSDRQLAAFRLAIRSSAEVHTLRSWLGSTELPDGVLLDRELTWTIVEQLSSLTGDAQLIEVTARRDPSGSALASAARARARLPTPAAKEAAWRLLMEPSTTSAYELYATAEGFFDPAQSDLTGNYVRRYFAEVSDTAAFRAGWWLGKVAQLAFPRSATTEATLALAERTLRRDVLAPAVRRALTDGTDQLRRGVSALSEFEG